MHKVAFQQTPRALLVLIPISLLLGGCTTTSSTESATNQEETQLQERSNVKSYTQAPGVLPEERIKDKQATVHTEKGDITFTFFADEAPATVSNFVFLAEDKFYDGLTFHRVVPGFVIQGGDPSGNGTGGPGYKFDDEPVKRTYSRGIVAMANSGPNTNGSQFFIMLEDNPLPPSYTIFGEVTSGIDVVDKIQVGDHITSVEITPKQ